MIDLDLDMRQYDCPFIDTTDEVDVRFSELDDENDVAVESRTDFPVAELFDVIENAGAAHSFLNSCRKLTETERETIVTAAEAKYFETSREMSLDDLADESGVSRTAVSMNLRRAERKLVDSTVDSLSSIDGLE